ncbi:iron ABC transporter permease [Vicingaceae bacterium]|nr:iron ABC transporter permease [Vicingaceae bacterium]
MQYSHRNKWFLLIGIIPILVLANLFFGSVTIPLTEIIEVFQGDSSNLAWEMILFESRLPRVFAAILCGSAISISGFQMQVLFRNALAGPYILGISSGASLGVSLLVLTGGWLFGGMFVIDDWSIALASTLGAMLILLLVFATSIRVKDIMTVLIVGIMLGALTTAIIGVLQYSSSSDQLKSFVIWTLGSLDGINYNELFILSIAVIIGLVLALSQLKPLNLLLMGEAYSKSMGINLVKSRLLIILSAGILAGSVTAFCGPIGFIGIVVPHLCRVWFQTSNARILIPAIVLLGINIMLLSDCIAHLPFSDLVLPLNSITAILGIPIIFWMVLGRKNISSNL